MKVILKNTKLNFVMSKELVKVGEQAGYMDGTGTIQSWSNCTVVAFDVSKVKKVSVTTKVATMTNAVICTFKKSASDSVLSSYITSVSGGEYSGIVNVLDGNILYVNCLTEQLSNLSAEIVELNTIDGEEVTGVDNVGKILDANGDMDNNQYFHVLKYDVLGLNFVDIYTKLNNTSQSWFALKKNNSTIAVVSFDVAEAVKKGLVVDVRNADEIWVNCIASTNASCFEVR